jgi:ribose transport system ATP-binding protein
MSYQRQSPKPEYVLEMRGIGKSYPGVRALKGVDFRLRRGQVHALVGENGAGKSTLMKILAGAERADVGEMVVAGHQVERPSPTTMLHLGIAVIYQELMVAPHLTVAENIFLGRLGQGRRPIINWRQIHGQAEELCDRFGVRLDVRARVDRLSVADKQLVEIAKALSREAKILVLDEPTAVLHENEVAKLFETMRILARKGVSFVYISHRLNEIFEIADHVTVLRDGERAASESVRKVSADQVVRWMVGRDCSTLYPAKRLTTGPEVLRCRGLRRGRSIQDVDLVLHRGEIVGICGLAGAGRTEVLRAIGGADQVDAGETFLYGQRRKISSPRQALRAGVGIAPEERKTQGLFLQHSVAFNVTMPRLSAISKGGLLDSRKERRVVETFREHLQIKTPSIIQKVRNLSGGNQQKCVLASRLHAGCKILLIDEPTRGIDIGAKRDIYQLLTQLVREQGLAILMVSSELPEILGLCDRIYVMRAGRLVGEFTAEEATEEKIMHLAAHSAPTYPAWNQQL